MQYDTHDWHGLRVRSMFYRQKKEYLEREHQGSYQLACQMVTTNDQLSRMP